MVTAPATFTKETLSKLSVRDLKILIWRQKWLQTARPEQIPPDGDWNEAIFLAGRGWGKTITGVQWLGYEALTDPEALPSFIIAPTLNDVRYTCFEGHTGLLTLLPQEVIADYNKTNLIVTLDNGAIIRGFSAEEPERLRGPQAARGLLEETAAWGPRDEETFDMFMMGLRLGPRPKFVCTTTPKARELIRKLAAPKKNRIVTSGSTYQNKANLPESFFDQLKQYEGTTLGRQELNGEIIDGEEGGVIQRSWLRLWPHDKPLPKFEFIILSLDTAFTSFQVDKRTQTADPTACGVGGVFWYEDTPQIMALDSWEDHLGLPDLVKRVKKEAEVHYGDDIDAPMLQPMFGPARSTQGYGAGRKADIILIEDKGSGISLRQSLEREGILTYAYNPGRADKLTRLHLVSHIFAQKRFWVPESENPSKKGLPKSWMEPAIQQLCSFKGTGSLKHDDHIDVWAQLVRLAVDKGMLQETKKLKSERDKDRDREENPAPRNRGNPYAQ